MLRALSGNKVRYLIVGAYAMSAYGYPRATGDLDIFVENTPENSRNLHQALKEFGAPLTDISESTFTEPSLVLQVGVAPRRLDFITSIDGIAFSEAYASKTEFEIDDLRIPFLSKANLIKNKKATGRQKDLLDAAMLEQK